MASASWLRLANGLTLPLLGSLWNWLGIMPSGDLPGSGRGLGADDGWNCRRLGIAASRNRNSRLVRKFFNDGGSIVWHLSDGRLNVGDANCFWLRRPGIGFCDEDGGPDVETDKGRKFEGS